MLQEANLDLGIGNGCRRSVSKDVESLVFLQTSHAKMNLLTEARIFGHKTLANKELISFLAPGWELITEVYKYSMRN